jgi:hypothetical protein
MAPCYTAMSIIVNNVAIFFAVYISCGVSNSPRLAASGRGREARNPYVNVFVIFRITSKWCLHRIRSGASSCHAASAAYQATRLTRAGSQSSGGAGGAFAPHLGSERTVPMMMSMTITSTTAKSPPS